MFFARKGAETAMVKLLSTQENCTPVYLMSVIGMMHVALSRFREVQEGL